MKKISYITILIFTLFVITGCGKKVIIIESANYQEYVDSYYNIMGESGSRLYALDLRTLEKYREGHFQGFNTYSYNPNSATEFTNWAISNIGKKYTIFLIDTNGAEAVEAAKQLRSAGYSKIYLYKGGYSELVRQAGSSFKIITGDDCGC